MPTFFRFFDDNVGMEIWDRIREGLAAQERTQEWLAGQIGVRADSLNRWLIRKTMPNADQVVAIAVALGTTAEYLVTGRRPSHVTPEDRALLEKAHPWRTVLEDLEALEPAVAASWAAGIHGAAVAARETKKLRGAG